MGAVGVFVGSAVPVIGPPLGALVAGGSAFVGSTASAVSRNLPSSAPPPAVATVGRNGVRPGGSRGSAPPLPPPPPVQEDALTVLDFSGPATPPVDTEARYVVTVFGGAPAYDLEVDALPRDPKALFGAVQGAGGVHVGRR